MSKLVRKADVEFFQKKRNDLEALVNEAGYFEKFLNEGRTVEEEIAKGKKALGLGDDDSIQLEYEAVMKKMNVEAQAFISLVNSIANLEETGMLNENEVKTLREKENILAKKLAERYEVDVERLYAEVNEGENNE